MKVAVDLSLQPDVLVWKFNCTSPLTNDTEPVSADVVPISFVDKSIYSTVPPFHTALISPALAFEPLAAVYLKNAAV